ncbi:MAG: spermidine synthase [Gammaproteobacteria bacterium]|jgi:spermidine synthase
MSAVTDPTRAQTHGLLLGSTFVIATCGLVYELLAGTISSYLLGDSVYQFSLVIGLFMAAMGLGSFLSRYVNERLLETFIVVQLFIAVIGGTSALVLFHAFTVIDNYTAFLLLELIVIGTAVGLEIPLVIRILEEHQVLKVNVSNVLTLDYLGALFASLLFPLVLVPQLGLIQTSILFGLLNALVAGLAVWTFRGVLLHRASLTIALLVCCVGLLGAIVKAEALMGFFEGRLFAGEVIYAESSPYQRIVVTRSDATINLFINGALQFSSVDEYRYHESLVHPVMSLSRRQRDILVLGGGDGMAVREILKHAAVESVTVVDLDPAMTALFQRNKLLRTLNGDSLSDPRVKVINEDAWQFLETHDEKYDVVIIDLPDPHNLSLSKLYSKSFYSLLAQRLKADSAIVTQATSPMFATEAFWSIAHTLASVTSPFHLEESLQVRPYHAYVPSFGEWGFVMAAPHLGKWQSIALDVPTRFLDQKTLQSMVHFSPDIAEVDTEINTIFTHALPKYYENGWSKWYE